MKKKQMHLIISIIFILLVFITFFLLVEEEFVLHELNKTLCVVLILLVYMVGSFWVLFHHKAKYNNQNKKEKI